MNALWIPIGVPLLLLVYTYLLYPSMMHVMASLGTAERGPTPTSDWPLITITVPAYNEEAHIRATLENLLQLDYPADRRHILVISDHSSDATDTIVEEYKDRGVELLRMPERVGKTAAQNAARSHLRGKLIVNIDASISVAPHALKPLIAAFGDPSVGVASGRDISTAFSDDLANVGESGYVGYEMWVRGLESRVYGIVGASGCFYAKRAELNHELLPGALSRDFATPLIAREHGYRSVSVNDAICYVPRAGSLRHEYRRKVRTMTRGIETLYYKRHLLNPFRYGVFSWMLFSHKVCRWLIPVGLLAATASIAVLGLSRSWAAWTLAILAIGAVPAIAGWAWPDGRKLPRVLAVPAFLALGNVAALHALFNAFRGELNPVWEPTRRDASVSP